MGMGPQPVFLFIKTKKLTQHWSQKSTQYVFIFITISTFYLFSKFNRNTICSMLLKLDNVLYIGFTHLHACLPVDFVTLNGTSARGSVSG